jgi:transposase-like protein
MARGKRVLSPESGQDAVKFVIDSSRPIAQVARELGLGEAARVSAKSLWERCDQQFCGVTRRAW